jgi:L-histidine N-alpha-methyltransferase
MKTPRFIQRHHHDEAAVREELLRGLLAPHAVTSPKYLYDALGSRLFEAITELPEYYPTRTEAAIFADCGDAMAACVPKGASLIDLGAGNCAKAASLFGRFVPSRYVAVDISVDFLRHALESLQRQYPALDMVGVGLDFSAGLALPPEVVEGDEAPRLLFYPGSSIGNFTPDEALAFLRSVRMACGPVAGSGLLIGVDLVKDPVELQAAYDDALGVTAAFNRNLLPHINRLAGTDFRLADWRHAALFDTALSRIEMHLEAVQAVTVCWPGGERRFAEGERRFAAGERIHTENSYKWTLDGFAQLLHSAGFASSRHWTDPAARFAVFWADA